MAQKQNKNTGLHTDLARMANGAQITIPQGRDFPMLNICDYAAKSHTCNNVPDWLYQSGEGRNLRLPVLPHGLPNNKATGQPKSQVRLLERHNGIIIPYVD